MSRDDPDRIPNPLPELLGFQLRRASVAAMNALAAALEPLGLRPTEATLLKVIGADPGQTQAAVARALGVQPGNLVAMINKLVQLGALVRAEGDGRGRAVSLCLTERGEALLAEVDQAFRRHDERISRSLPPELRAEVIEALNLICRDACCD